MTKKMRIKYFLKRKERRRTRGNLFGKAKARNGLEKLILKRKKKRNFRIVSSFKKKSGRSETCLLYIKEDSALRYRHVAVINIQKEVIKQSYIDDFSKQTFWRTIVNTAENTGYPRLLIVLNINRETNFKQFLLRNTKFHVSPIGYTHSFQMFYNLVHSSNPGPSLKSFFSACSYTNTHEAL